MVKKLGRGKWAARVWWRTPEGEKQKSKYQSGFKTKGEAVAWETAKREEYKAERARLAGKTDSGDGMTLSELTDRYLERLKLRESSPSTIDNNRMCAKRYLPILGDKLVDDITPLDVQECIDTLRTRPNGELYRSATVRGTYRVLRAVLNRGVALGILDSSPCRGIDLPREQTHHAVIYTGEQISDLLTTLRDQNDPLYWPVSFCARYALRRGEALGVRWQDIDFERKVLHVRANVACSESTAYCKTAKTKSSETTVALSTTFLEELRVLMDERIAAGLMRLGNPEVVGVTPFAELDPCEFVCLDVTGKVISPLNLTRRLKLFQERNGLLISGWHDLRHTYGTLMAEAGVDVVTISKAMRHSSISMTSDQYISSTDQLKRNATDAMMQIIQFEPASTPEEKQPVVADV